jgi:hypothetical protein
MARIVEEPHIVSGFLAGLSALWGSGNDVELVKGEWLGGCGVHVRQ